MTNAIIAVDVRQRTALSVQAPASGRAGWRPPETRPAVGHRPCLGNAVPVFPSPLGWSTLIPATATPQSFGTYANADNFRSATWRAGIPRLPEKERVTRRGDPNAAVAGFAV